MQRRQWQGDGSSGGGAVAPEAAVSAAARQQGGGGGVSAAVLRKLQFLRYLGTYFGTYARHEL
jgi:hypothetical protein